MIVQGEGEIELVNEDQKEGEGVVHKLKAGTMYALNGQERHFLRASADGDMHAIWSVLRFSVDLDWMFKVCSLRAAVPGPLSICFVFFSFFFSSV